MGQLHVEACLHFGGLLFVLDLLLTVFLRTPAAVPTAATNIVLEKRHATTYLLASLQLLQEAHSQDETTLETI